MRVIVSERDTGKTHELLRLAEQAHGIVLTNNKHALQVKAEAYGFKDIPIIDYTDLRNDTYPLGYPLFVHNGEKALSWLLKQYFYLNTQGMTATITEPQFNKNNKNQKKNN